MNISICVFAVAVSFILIVILQVDIKMYLRYLRGSTTTVTVYEFYKNSSSDNYERLQMRNYYFLYKVSFMVPEKSGLQHGILWSKEKLNPEEMQQTPYWIEKDGSLELTQRNYYDRLKRLLFAFSVAVVFILSAILFL